MKVNQIRFSSIKPEQWSGGKTYQYYIFPLDCQYINKDFIFRVSSATIEQESSIFTKFAGFHRYLTMLNNELVLTINNQNYHLNNNEIISFYSEDQVVSYSKGQDFNLMINQNIKDHNLEVVSGLQTSDYEFIIIYSLKKQDIIINKIDYTLEVNDCLIIENQNKEKIVFNVVEEIILGNINIQ